jgi:tRNA(Ile)-lysidine synthase TilS/MesJ
MKCIKCNSQAEILNIQACSRCFVKIIEKRVRKEIRFNKLISKNDTILIIDDNSAEAQVNMYVINHIVKGLPLNIIIKKSRFKLGQKFSGANKVVVPWNTDKEDEYFLTGILNNTNLLYLGHYKLNETQYIKLLLRISASEVKTFAEINRMSYKGNNTKSIISEMIDKLEREYPETKFSLLKSTLHFYK